MKLLKGSTFLKLSALIVAVLTYFYIHGEIYNREKENQSDPSYKLIKLTAKSLPVKLRLETFPPEGYRVLQDKVVIEPERIVVIGPEALLEEATDVETSNIDISESTKTATKKIPLENVAGIHLSGESYVVDVTVPIEKLPEEARPA